MNAWQNRFERRWTVVFGLLYLVILLPFPFFYSEEYLPSLAGLPSFLVGWTVHALITFLCIGLFAARALKRPEYHRWDEMGDKEGR